jgi:hypothetical protein
MTYRQTRLTVLGWFQLLCAVAGIALIPWGFGIGWVALGALVAAVALALLALGLGLEHLEVADGLLTGRRSNRLTLGPVALADIAATRKLPVTASGPCLRMWMRTSCGVGHVEVTLNSGERLVIATRAPKRLRQALAGEQPLPLFRRLWTAESPAQPETSDLLRPATAPRRAFVML